MCYNGYGIGIELFWNGRIKDGRWSNKNTGSSHLKVLYMDLIESPSQGFQGAREHDHKIIGNKATKGKESHEHGNKSCVSDILGNRDHKNWQNLLENNEAQGIFLGTRKHEPEGFIFWLCKVHVSILIEKYLIQSQNKSTLANHKKNCLKNKIRVAVKLRCEQTFQTIFFFAWTVCVSGKLRYQQQKFRIGW